MTENGLIQAWLAAARRGDRLALTKLLTIHHHRLRTRAKTRLPAVMEARTGPEDVLQEVYLDVFRQIDRFEDRGPGSFTKWLYGILDRKLAATRRAMHAKARDVNREVPAERSAADSYWNLFDHVYADSGTPSRAMRREEAMSALLACVAGLASGHRRVIQLRFLEGLSVREVAARLGKSEAAIVALTRRALDALRASMDQMGEFTHGV